MSQMVYEVEDEPMAVPASFPTNNTVELKLVLSEDRPPGAEQVIVYGYERLNNGSGVIHSNRCEYLSPYGTLVPRETVGRELLQRLGDDQINIVCSFCFPGQWAQMSTLVKSAKALCETGREHEAEPMLMMHYELWKPEPSKWTEWLVGKTTDQIRAAGQQHVHWDNTPGSNQVVVFETSEFVPSGWLIGLGDYAPVRRREVDGFIIHSLMPEETAERTVEAAAGDYDYAQIVVPVDKNFTKEHLAVAVNIYEDDKMRRWNSTEREAAVKRAVETAWLVLS